MIPDALLTALATMSKSFGTNFKALIAAVEALPAKLNIQKSVDLQTRVLTVAVDEIKTAVAKASNPQVTVDFDTSALTDGLTNAAATITAAIPKAPNLENAEASLKIIYDCIEKGNAATVAALTNLAESIRHISFTAPDVISINPTQINELKYASAGQPAARKATLKNTTIANASTEYSYTFPRGTVAWTLRLRDQGTLAYYSWKTGTTPSGGDSSLYFTIPQNFLRSTPNTDYGQLTIYFGAEAATVAEIESWVA